MKVSIFGLCLLLMVVHSSSAQTQNASSTPSKAEQELLDLSKAKWLWMSDKKVDSLNALFDEKAVFVHMG